MDLFEKACQTIEEMLEDRNYIPLRNGIPETDIKKRVVDSEYLTKSCNMAFVTKVDSTSQIKNYYSLIKNPDYETIIFIYTNNVTVTHKTIEANLNNKIEIWSIDSLLVNASKHVYQPKVEKISKTSKIKGKLPKISFYDPIVRYYKFQRKDIIKVTNRQTELSHYRIVV